MKNKEIDSPFIGILNKRREERQDKERIEKMISFDSKRIKKLKVRKTVKIVIAIVLGSLAIWGYSQFDKIHMDNCRAKGLSQYQCEKTRG